MQNLEFKTNVIKPVECFKEGWEIIKPNFWLYVAITFVGIVIAILIPFSIAIGAMFCGIYICFFQMMDGKPLKFESLFDGFKHFGAGLVATLVIIVPALIFTLISYVSIIALFLSSIDKNGQLNEAVILKLYGLIFVETIIISLVIGCLHTLIMFTYPLIVDYQMKGWDAFKLSAKAVWQNLGGVTGLILVELVLGIIGYLMCVVGVYLVLPIMFAGVGVAYRKVFPRVNQYNSPPSPPVNWS